MSPRSSLKSACESAFDRRARPAPGESLGRVEPPLGDGGIDDAPDVVRAHLERLRDLLVGKAGNEEVDGLPPFEVFGPALFRQGPPSAR